MYDGVSFEKEYNDIQTWFLKIQTKFSHLPTINQELNEEVSTKTTDLEADNKFLQNEVKEAGFENIKVCQEAILIE